MSDIAHARRIRAERGRILASLKDGTLSLRQTLRNPPACLLACTVHTVIEAGFNMGPTGTTKLLKACDVGPLETLGAIPPHIRQRIVNQLPNRAT